MKTICSLAALVILFAVAPAVANAQCPSGVYPGLYGLGGFRGLYGNGHFEKRPYFALNPPVYYSQPVARPYGYSPYALPPGVQPAEPRIVETPAAIVNPFFTSGKAASEKKEKARDRATSFETPAAPAEKTPPGIQTNPFYKPQKSVSNEFFTSVK